MNPTKEDRELMNRLEAGLRMVTVPMPHFTGLVHSVRLELDDRVPTMGVFASGRLLINRRFAQKLREDELTFVLAHELFHLALRTHDRAVGSNPLEFNIAHDYIINDILRQELGFAKVPAGGLDMPGASQKSAEQILMEMERRPRAEGNSSSGDVLDGQVEREMFPGEGAEGQEAKAETLKEIAARALSLGTVMGSMPGRGRGKDAGGSNQMVAALRGMYKTPWEMALQRWLESVAPTDRTFVRPSRRGAERTDVVMPGRKREGWILNVLLDTSGSMTEELTRALGAIADFCEAAAVNQVRIVQCDTAVTGDQLLDPGELGRYAITGYGGSDMSPGLRHLAEDPHVQSVVVLTDGEISYPQEEMPFDLLWILPPHGDASFQPPYGTVLRMR